MRERRLFFILGCCFIAIFLMTNRIVFVNSITSQKLTEKEKLVANFIADHVAIVEPLMRETYLASWEAAVTGSEEAYKKTADLQFKLEKIYTSKDDFLQLKGWKDSGEVKEPLLARQLKVLYLAYLGNQIPEELLKKIVDKGTEAEQLFSTFRSKVDEKEVTMNDINMVFQNSTDSEERKKYWEAQKASGKAVEATLKEVVHLRNEAAKVLGFPNYFVMSLTLSEQDEAELLKLFDELDSLTRQPFASVKKEVDQYLAQRCGIQPQEVRPWHYEDPFFQEAPDIYKVDLNRWYEKTNILELSKSFYSGIGLPVEEILQRSDLYEKKGKNPHAFTSDIDRKGDVRVLANIKNNERWMGTMLHELGHGVYDKYMEASLPFILRHPAHSFTTEAIAILFERMSKNPWWIQQMLGLSDSQRMEFQDSALKLARLQGLVFCRWTQVMFRFERELYRNPEQNLNRLWWDLVEKYQMVSRPEGRDAPDYAAKIHFCIAPVYYHNYQMGELLASQLRHYIITHILKGADIKSATYLGRKEVGEYLKGKVFALGATLPWNEMVKQATGEPLTARYFAEQFVK